MAIPSLPAEKNTDDIIDNAWVDAVRDLLRWGRDDIPSLKVRWTGGSSIPSGEESVIPYCTSGALNSNSIQDVNVGPFGYGDAGESGFYIPETGLYLVSGWASFTADNTADTRREIILKDEGTAIPFGGRVRVPAVKSASVSTEISTGAVFQFFTAGDLFDMFVYQNTGSSNAVSTAIQAVFVNSAAT